MAAFINEWTAPTPHPSSRAETAARHLHAWLMTAGVVAVDLLALGYFASRRHRKSAARRQAQWWEDPSLDQTMSSTVPDFFLRLPNTMD